MTESSTSGILKSKAQYDRSLGKVQTIRTYREAMIQDLSNEIERAREEEVDDVILAGDFNQDLQGEQMKMFMRENGLVEVYHTINNIEEDHRDNTHKTGSKQIDAVMATDGLIESIVGSKLTEFNEIINTDHRRFIVDIDIKKYFAVDSSSYDQN